MKISLPHPYEWRFDHANGQNSAILIYTKEGGVIARKALNSDNPMKEGYEFLEKANIQELANEAKTWNGVIFIP